MTPDYLLLFVISVGVDNDEYITFSVYSAVTPVASCMRQHFEHIAATADTPTDLEIEIIRC